MAGSEEHLFRQFRLPWVPTWVPDWLEAVLRASLARPTVWKMLAVALLTVGVSYFGWKWLENRTGQESVDLMAWESRLQSASSWDAPLLMDSLFQVQNDAAMALGVRQLSSPDPQRRQIAGFALRDAYQKWNQWSPEKAAEQRERAVRWLAQVVGGLHAPEQSIAVEIARQSLLQPSPTDPTIRDSLLANSRVLFAQAHPAHTAAVRWDESNNVNGSSSLTRDSSERTGSNTNGTLPFDPNNRVAASRNFGANETSVNSSASGSDNNRFRPAGFSRPSNNEPWTVASSVTNQTASDNGPRTSQIPLFDGEGRLIEVQAIDPTDSTTPGGLIPVGMSGSARLPNSSRSGSPNQSEIESGYRESSAPSTRSDFNRIGDSRINGMGSVATAPTDSTIPGRTGTSDSDDDLRKRELAAALQLRAQSISATRQGPSGRVPTIRNGDSRSEPGTETVTSEPGANPPPMATPRVDRSTTPGAAVPRAIAQNPYRMGDGSPSEQMQPLPETPLEDMIDWRSMSHIEVMFRLRDENPETARQAARELDRRGFNSEYVAAARRLTNPDPREREQLILDLVASHRIEPMPFLRWLANDPDPDVQSLAINALEMLQASVRNRGADALNEARRRR